MSKKESTLKTYRAKVNLPGGCAKDTLICNGKYVSTGLSCPYDCVKEKSFFEEILPSKYTIGSTVIGVKQQEDRQCDLNGETNYAHKLFSLPAFTQLTIKGEKHKNKVVYVIIEFPQGIKKNLFLIPEKDISISEMYFFVSSKGTFNSDYTGRDSPAENYRKSIGNFHKTKEEAIVYKDRLMQLQIAHTGTY